MKVVYSFLLLLHLAWIDCIFAQYVYYVSPSGDDNNSGTIEKPFQTIFKARDYLIEHHLVMDENIIIYLREGVHQLDRTFQLLYPNSGSNGYRITYKAYPGEHVVISGGQKVNGWEQYKKGIWKAKVDLPGFRQLYVNGRRAVRARGNMLTGSREFGQLSEANARVGFKTGYRDIARWKNISDVELILVMTWCHMIAKVDTAVTEEDSVAVIMKQPLYYFLVNKPGRTDRYLDHVENALELLDEENEWYFDKREKYLYYKPLAGMDINSADIIVPAIERLVSIKGTANDPVSNISFDRIWFMYGGWLQPSEIGHPEIQANVTQFIHGYPYRHTEYYKFQQGDAMKSMANVGISFSRNIRFTNCMFMHLGGAGLDFGRGSQNCQADGCVFTDISANGINIGDVRHPDHHPPDSVFVTMNNTISNCYIRNVACEYQGGVGIFAGYTVNTIIRDNEICMLPYTGISVGWGWGEFDYPNYSKSQFVMYMSPAASAGNRVLNNHIHHVMLIRQDGAGIYTLGQMPGSFISGNYLHDNRKAHDIYLDEGTGYVSVTGNVIVPSKHGAGEEIKLHNLSDKLMKSCLVEGNLILSPGEKNEKAIAIIREAGIKQNVQKETVQGLE